MLARISAVGVLAALALLTATGDVSAFGRRHTTTYCPPVYYCPIDPCYCPPYFPPFPVNAGWDCLCNRTDKVLRVHVTSGYGSFEAVLSPGDCTYFWFVKDSKPRVLSAFTLDNTLIDLTTFLPLDQTGRPFLLCFPIIQNQPTTTKEQQRERVQGSGGAHPTPTNKPF